MRLTSNIQKLNQKDREASQPYGIDFFASVHKNSSSEDPCHADCFKILILVAGKCTLHVDLKEETLDPDSMFVFLPGQYFSLRSNEAVSGYVLSFTSAFVFFEEPEYDSAFQYQIGIILKQARKIIIDGCDRLEINSLLEKMNFESHHNYSMRALIMRRYFRIFFIHVCRQFEKEVQTLESPFNTGGVHRFMNLVETNFQSLHKVADYAGLLSVTPNYLNEVVKNQSGYPAGHFIRQRVVLEAKKQASYFDRSLKEVAYNLGFSDLAHFSKYFKRLTGVNFSDFKKQRDTSSISILN